MGKWAERLVAHLAEETPVAPTAAPSKPPKGAFDPFEGGGQGVREEYSSAANDAADAAPREQGLTDDAHWTLTAAIEAAPDKPRHHRLSRAEGDAAHARTWDDAACAQFVARVGLFMRRGIHAADADDLAERLHLRDVQSDERALCLECAYYRSGRCGNHRRAGLHSPDLGRNLAGLLQRCPGFQSTR